MADQTAFWEAVGGLGVIAGATGIMYRFVINRHDLLSERIDGVEERAKAAIDLAKREAGEALMAHSDRTDARQEQVRKELAQSVRELNGRIDRIDNDMARRDDVRALGDQVSNLSSRIDRVLEMRN